MPKKLVYDVDVDVPAGVMYRHFTTIGYWEDLVEHYRANNTRTEIAHFRSDENGTDIAFAHIISGADLPALARPVFPGTFVVTREQHFDPFVEQTNRADGRYRAIVPHVPVDVEGDYTISDRALADRGAADRGAADPGTGSRMRLQTRCTARVPLIGGQIEGMILGGLKGLFAGEGEFTADWIAAHS